MQSIIHVSVVRKGGGGCTESVHVIGLFVYYTKTDCYDTYLYLMKMQTAGIRKRTLAMLNPRLIKREVSIPCWGRRSDGDDIKKTNCCQFQNPTYYNITHKPLYQLNRKQCFLFSMFFIFIFIVFRDMYTNCRVNLYTQLMKYSLPQPYRRNVNTSDHYYFGFHANCAWILYLCFLDDNTY